MCLTLLTSRTYPSSLSQHHFLLSIQEKQKQGDRPSTSALDNAEDDEETAGMTIGVLTNLLNNDAANHAEPEAEEEYPALLGYASTDDDADTSF